MPALVHRALAETFRAAAWLRRGRALHSAGVLVRGTLLPRPGRLLVAPFDRAERLRVTARLSKAAGTPGTLPDVLGLALRVEDAGGPGRPFDLLLSSCPLGVGLRHVPVPTGSWTTPYGSLVPYRAAGRTRLLAALPADPGRRVPASLADARQAIAERPLEFVLAQASLTGQWHSFGRLDVMSVLDDEPEVRFDPGNALTGLHPTGPVQAVREAAYADSRTGSRHHQR